MYTKRICLYRQIPPILFMPMVSEYHFDKPTADYINRLFHPVSSVLHQYPLPLSGTIAILRFPILTQCHGFPLMPRGHQLFFDAAIILAITPPTGFTEPKMLISPVIATLLFIGLLVIALYIAVAMVIPADGPSTGIPPGILI